MRINEYQSLEEFTSQYTGEWSPSDGHWFGLEFRYEAHDYRLHTGIMHSDDPEQDSEGREILFGLYAMNPHANEEEQFRRLASFVTMDDLLCYTGIGDRPFREVIMDDSTQILGQD